MAIKPTTAAGYTPAQLLFVRQTALYVATKLGDLMDDLVIVGGLVPSLLINQEALPKDTDPHVGTMDLDIGLAVSLLDQGKYRELSERLRRAGFEQDVNEEGNPTRQRWRTAGPPLVTVDFLIPPSLHDDRGGKLRNIEPDFAAIIAPGLHLAFKDKERISLSGQTILGEEAVRVVWVCGPGAYVVLKAIAFRLRGENKDAYDLYYLLKNYGSGIDDVANRLKPMLEDSSASQAIDILKGDFQSHDGLGPRRVAEFISRVPDNEIQADVVGFVGELLKRCGY